ncbi:MAG: helix-turn-helix domain-containing protein [Planctomycetota bacterium]|jgi:hypothetical protein
MEPLVEAIEASEPARERAKVLLLTIAGQWSVQQGCEHLGLSRTRLQDLRRRMLEAAVGALEGGAAGRPRRRKPREEACLEQLRAQVVSLTHELRLARAEVDLYECGVGAVVRRRKERKLAPCVPGRN